MPSLIPLGRFFELVVEGLEEEMLLGGTEGEGTEGGNG